MRIIRLVVMAVFGVATLSGCGVLATAVETPPEVVERNGATGSILKGTRDGVPYINEAMAHVHERDGKVAVCAFYRMNAPADVSGPLAEALRHPRSLMLIKKADGTHTLSIKPDFVRVIYSKTTGDPNVDEIIRQNASSKAEGNCVVTDRPWQTGLAGGKVEYVLYRNDDRRRSLTVVGESK